VNNFLKELGEEELKAIEKFKKTHLKKCPSKGYKNPLYSYILTPTGIGIGVAIRCNNCRFEQDVTDYSLW
jgi:hypothetical protein